MLNTLVGKLMDSGFYTRPQAEKTARRIIIDSSLKEHKVKQYAIGGFVGLDPMQRAIKRGKNVIPLNQTEEQFPQENNEFPLREIEDDGMFPAFNPLAYLSENQQQEGNTPFYPTPTGEYPFDPTNADLRSITITPKPLQGGISDMNIDARNADIIPPTAEDINAYNNSTYDDRLRGAMTMDIIAGQNPFDGNSFTSQVEKPKTDNTTDNTPWWSGINPYGYDLETSLYMAGKFLGSSPTTSAGKAGKVLGAVGSLGKVALGGSRAFLSGMGMENARERYLAWERKKQQRQNDSAGRQTNNTRADHQGGITRG